MTDFFGSQFSLEQFLGDYWQQKPLLIRQAFPAFEPFLNIEELAGLACEEDVESRLILEQGEAGPWQLSHGPFDEADFADLPPSHWTLLVQDVDKHVPELAALLKQFDFIPEWRRDDLMVSFAPVGGSVGPHTDGYDVFLLQAMGSRRWQISDSPVLEAEFLDGLDLKILAQFQPDQSWDLNPGDMLYLPPHYAHHGVALNDCMTYSIGFRAPTQVELLDSFMHVLMEHGAGQQRYRDPPLAAESADRCIDHKALEQFKHTLVEAISGSDALVLEAVGRLLTETKPSLENLADDLISEPQSTEDQFAKNRVLKRNPYLRLAWSDAAVRPMLFAAGEAYELPPAALGFLPDLTQDDCIDYQDWQKLQRCPELQDVINELVEAGCWYWEAV